MIEGRRGSTRPFGCASVTDVARMVEVTLTNDATETAVTNLVSVLGLPLLTIGAVTLVVAALTALLMRRRGSDRLAVMRGGLVPVVIGGAVAVVVAGSGLFLQTPASMQLDPIASLQNALQNPTSAAWSVVGIRAVGLTLLSVAVVALFPLAKTRWPFLLVPTVFALLGELAQFLSRPGVLDLGTLLVSIALATALTGLALATLRPPLRSYAAGTRSATIPSMA